MLHLPLPRFEIAASSSPAGAPENRGPLSLITTNLENMTPKTYPMLTSRILLRWLFTLCLTAGTLFAQSTGTITGRVFDQATGRSLQGAIVQVKGTAASAVTDTEGRFTLSGVPAGAASVDVEYVGLDPATQSIAVAAGATARLDVGLKSSVLQMQAFEVQEAARGQALAINQQK